MIKVFSENVGILKPLSERFRDVGLDFELVFLPQFEQQLGDALIAARGESVDLMVVGDSFSVKETVAEVYNRQMVYDKKAQIDLIRLPEKEKKVRAPAEYEMEKLLLFPEDFSTFTPKYGYECACMGKHGSGDIILIPDNSDEVLYTVDNYILPYFSTKQKFSIVQCYRIFGVEKSEILHNLAEFRRLVTVKFFVETDCALDSKLSVCFSPSIAKNVKEKIIEAVFSKFKDNLYADGDCELEEVAVKLLELNGTKLAVAESLTGGLIASKIVNVVGSSRVFTEGTVAYSNESKVARLGVSGISLSNFGAVSSEVAYEMSVGVLNTAGTDYALSTTGIAGPGGASIDKPVGLVYVSLGNSHGIHVFKYLFDGDRNQVRIKTAKNALFQLIKLLKNKRS